MRRAAGNISTGPAPTYQLKQLAARGLQIPHLCHHPSALVYISHPHSSISNRRFSAKATANTASWHTAREDSYWKELSTPSKSNDSRLGQEEGQRLIKAAFSNPGSVAGTNRISPKKSRLSKQPKQPKRRPDRHGATSTIGQKTRAHTPRWTSQEKRSTTLWSPASLDSVASKILEGRSDMARKSRAQTQATWPVPSSRPDKGRRIVQPGRRSSRLGMEISPIYQDLKVRPRMPEGEATSGTLSLGSWPSTSPEYREGSLKRWGTRSNVPFTGRALRRRGDKVMSPASATSPPTSVGIQLVPLKRRQSVPPKPASNLPQFSEFEWEPRIRHSFGKRWASEPEAGELADLSSVKNHKPGSNDQVNSPSLLPTKSLKEQRKVEATLLQRNQHSRLIAEIWEKAPDLQRQNCPVLRARRSQNTSQESGVNHLGPEQAGTKIRTARVSKPERYDDLSGWQNFAEYIHLNTDPVDQWDALAPLMHNNVDLLSRSESSLLRDVLLEAAVGDDMRLNQFMGAVKSLKDEAQFDWPELYGNIMYRLLDDGEPARAVFWHSRLYFNFPPSETVFATLLSHFVVDDSPEMQAALLRLHGSSNSTRLYDTIIARLFDLGQSASARRWRKRLLSFGDFPRSDASAPFLRFLSAYYPLLELTPEERNIAGVKKEAAAMAKTRSEADSEAISKSNHGDHMVAKWFASKWTTVTFAIDLIHRLGVTVLGPLALQSLGLRDLGAKSLAENLAHLERLGVALAPTMYCRVIAYFAKQGEDSLLEGLLTSDVHPDEFENLETVRMLAVAAESRQDTAQYRLMRGVETAMLTISAQDEHAHLVPSENISSFRSALTPTQGDIAETLDITFEQFGYHPLKWLYPRLRNPQEMARLAQAVAALRQAVTNDVPIPLDYWKRVLYNFGRLGRLKTLEQFCLELVEVYEASNSRRIPVHPNDFATPKHRQDLGEPVPQSDTASQARTESAEPKIDGLDLWQRALDGRATGVQEIGFIPSDLPFAHHQHPIRKVFHQKLQRNIIRWGFDNALRVMHPVRGASWRDRSMTRSTCRAAQISERGIGQGLRILSKLRDAGVVIDTQIIQSEIVRRTIAADFPGRGQAPWMDHHELSVIHILRLVNETWGPGIFDSLEELKSLLQARRAKIRHHYWKNRFLRASRPTEIP